MMHDVLIIAVAALCTFFTRLVPFVFFGRKQEVSPIVKYLGTYLPSAVMAILVIYCLKGLTFDSYTNYLPSFIAIASVVGLHLWKRNTLLSILGGTAIYMILIQIVF